MWDIANILACPYCKISLTYNLPLINCPQCSRTYYFRDSLYYMYDSSMPHWIKCEDQMDAVLSHVDINDLTPSQGCRNSPLIGLDMEGVHESQRVNGALLKIAIDLYGELMFADGYGIDIGSGCGWGSGLFSEYKRMVSLDICGHPHYGIGSQIEDMGHGIKKVVADSCYMPFLDNTFSIAFACSSFHHAHDKPLLLSELYRVLDVGGKFVAIGEVVVKPEHVADASKPEWVRMEGLPNTRESMLKLLADSPFDNIDYLPIRYTPNMHKLGYYSLVGEPMANGIIYGVKNENIDADK